jgi:hypothetical protein
MSDGALLTPRGTRLNRLGSRMSMFFRKPPVALEGEDQKPTLTIPDRLERLQQEYDSMMKFYKINYKKVDDLHNCGERLADYERVLGTQMGEFTDENQGFSVYDNMSN